MLPSGRYRARGRRRRPRRGEDGVSRGDLHTSPRHHLASGDRTGRNARPRCLQRCGTRRSSGRGSGEGRSDLLCAAHAETAPACRGCQRAWQPKALRQFKKASRPSSEPSARATRFIAQAPLAVVVRCVRQHDRAHLCMGRSELPAQYVARLWCKSHGGRPEARFLPRAV